MGIALFLEIMRENKRILEKSIENFKRRNMLEALYKELIMGIENIPKQGHMDLNVIMCRQPQL